MGTGTLNSYTSTGITLTATGAYNSPFTVTATGTVDTTGSYGVYSTLASPYLLNAGSVTGGNYGVGLLEGGAVTNRGASALIHGGRYGVVFKNGVAELANTGTIIAPTMYAAVYVGAGGTVDNSESYSLIYGGNGVRVRNTGAAVINAGTIAGGIGVYLPDGSTSTITNSTANAVISGASDGAFSRLGAANIRNAGTITGSAMAGIFLGGGGTINNTGESARIVGAYWGIDARAPDIINTGTIMATFAGPSTSSRAATGVGLLAGGTITNAASYSLIFGAQFGVVATFGAATIGNAGSIIGAAQDGVALHNGGTVTNAEAGALIFGAQRGVFTTNLAATIVNAGTITGAARDGIYLGKGGAISNTGTAAVISGGADGVLAYAARIGNAGTITGATNEGIYLTGGGTITNTAATALIQGANYGVVTNTAATTIANAGGITGQVTGIQARAAAYITNTGSIAGLVRYGAELRAGGSIANTAASAAISGGEDGVFATGAATSITNAGTITGLSNTGVYLKDGGAVTNGGTIAGAVDAIYSAGGFTLNALAGAVFDGRVVDQAGGGVLNLAGEAAGTLEMGGSFSGFSAINFGAAAWTLEGTGSELADGQTISGFTPGDTIDLSGFAATSASYAAGVGLVLSSGSYSYVLSLSGGGGVFSYYGDGEGGTDIGFGTHTLSTYTASGITLTADGQDLAPFTVTATGTVNSTGAYGVYSALASTYLLNAGSINPGGSSLGHVGVDLANGGTVTNSGASAIIQGAHYGVFLISGGDIANTGTILGMFGFNSDGVSMGGGTVTNSGRSALIVGLDTGVRAGNGADILNSGTIMSTDPTFDIIKPTGVALGEGNVANTQSYSLIFGGVFGVIAGGAATISNAGTITGAVGTGVWLRDGGSVTNTEAGARIDGAERGVDARGLAATILNAGTITGASSAVYLGAGGAVTNTGTASGADGVYLKAGGAVTNTGTAALISGGFNGVKDSEFVLVKATATVANAGTITGTVSNGVYLQNGGIVTNTGTAAVISGGQDGVLDKATATVANAGTITGASADGVYLKTGGIVTNTGSGAVIAGGTFGILAHAAAATIANGGTISGGNAGIYVNGGGKVVNGGTIGGGSYAVRFHGDDANLLLVDPGAVFIGQVAAAGAGSTLELAAGGGVLAGLGVSFTGFDTIAFDPGAAWSLSGTALGFSGVGITGITGADALDITDLGFVGAQRLSLGPSDVLAVTQGSDVLDLTFSSGDIGDAFSVTSDGNHGTELIETPLCYLHGTQILTPTGTRAVENLAIGDAVVTRFGGIQRIKWLGRQSYAPAFIAKNPEKWPVCIKAGALEAGVPARDLYVSPGHSMLLGDVLVLASQLINGVTITQTRPETELNYVQIDLGSHDCVVAEGAWSETFADAPGLRALFHNAAEYTALYPEEPPVERLSLCGTRPEQGPKLAAALAPVVARAAVTPGPLEGWIDAARDWKIGGWARDLANPALPVMLEILLGNTVIGTALACGFREDLRGAAKGSGHCAFNFTPPFRLRAEALATLTIRRAADGTELPSTRRNRLHRP